LGGEAVYSGSAEGVVDLVFNPELSDRLAPGLVEAVEEARARIRSGELEVPRVPFVEGEAEGS
jgi:hypothetical protein